VYLAYFEGDGWHGLGSGPAGLGEALVIDAGRLTIGGRFVAINCELPSLGLARWSFKP
jgi:hypothetical protein